MSKQKWKILSTNGAHSNRNYNITGSNQNIEKIEKIDPLYATNDNQISTVASDTDSLSFTLDPNNDIGSVTRTDTAHVFHLASRQKDLITEMFEKFVNLSFLNFKSQVFAVYPLKNVYAKYESYFKRTSEAVTINAVTSG